MDLKNDSFANSHWLYDYAVKNIWHTTFWCPYLIFTFGIAHNSSDKAKDHDMLISWTI